MLYGVEPNNIKIPVIFAKIAFLLSVRIIPHLHPTNHLHRVQA